ncbi:MAG: Repeat family [Pedosphaera sp.]|nr:Repeat family [Pedosphaera sp.]
MKKALFTLFATVALAAGSQASLILTERFSYPDGAIVGAPNSPWLSHSGTGGSMVCSNNQLVVSTARTEDVNAFLAGVTSLTGTSPYNTNSAFTVYSKFQVYFTQLPTTAGAYFAHFKDNNGGAQTGFAARIWASATNAITGGTVPAGKLRLGIGNGSSSLQGSGQIDTDLTTNVIYTVVTRFVPATGVSTIWLNPSLETDPSVTATDVGTAARPNALDVYAYALRQATGEGTMFIDNLKVATSFDDLSAPGISFIASQATPANTPTAAIPFTVVDDETPAASLTVAGTSSNTALVPNANIVFGGGGTNRTVTVTPATGQQGTTTITITCTDTDSKSTSVTFLLTVGAPVISSIPNITTPSNTIPAAVSFTVGDAESPAASLTLTGSSSNPTLIPNASIVFGGSASNRTVSVTPASGQIGIATITVNVSDGANTASTSFVVNVYPLLGVLFTENFNYPDGPLYNAAGSPWSHTSPTAANFFEVGVSNSQAVLSGGLQEDVSAGITNVIGAAFNTTNGYILYSGFTVTFSALPSAAGEYFAHFRDDGNSFRARIFATITNAAVGKFRLGIANQGGAASVTVPIDLSLGTNYSVVTKYVVGSGISTLWVNPQAEASSSVTATDAIGLSEITSYGLRQSTGIGTNSLDNLKIGTSFSDVATILVVTPPPPVSLNIALVSGNVQISWSTNSVGYALESKATITGATWTPVGQTPTVSGTNNVVTVTPTGTAFYRLNHP